MEIRFKFRSSPNFDTVDIGDQSSISIRDLKSKIVLKKHLNLCHDFDLTFFDHVSCLEYTDENTRIPAGSSVVVKRVPAKSSPSFWELDVTAGNVGTGNAHHVNNVEPPILDFGGIETDDFGVDLCPPLAANVVDYQKLSPNIDEKKDPLAIRCSAKVPVRGDKPGATLATQSNPKDFNANERSTLVMHSKPITKEQTVLARAGAVNNTALERFDMPLELKCSLCASFFKEAVMIPCCQHSFCEECIRLALTQNSRCPMCSSSKCKPEDLLPNLSLRQAIERFLNSRNLHNGLENDLDRYAPDGESGIQEWELSYAPTVQPRDFQLNRCATKVSASLLGDTKCDDVAFDNCTEFQGENEPLNTVAANEEGGERNFMAPGRVNKSLRTCYMCGSPDHLIRECPAAASSAPSSQMGSWCGNVPFQGVAPGYAPQYWPGNPPHCRPLYGMYSGPETMLYNANMGAVTPFGMSPYAPSMFSGYPVPRPLNFGNMAPMSGMNAHQMNVMNQTNPLGLMGCAKQQGSHNDAFESGPLNFGNMAPMPGINAHQMNQTNPLGLMGSAKQQGSHTDAFERREVFDRDHNVNRQLDNPERGPNHSGDSFARRSDRNYKSHERSDDGDKNSNGKRKERKPRSSEKVDDSGRSFRISQLDRPTSEKVAPASRTQPLEARHENSHRRSKRDDDMRKRHDRDSSPIHHHSNKERAHKRRTEHDRRSDREIYSHSGSGLEHSHSHGDGRTRGDESGARSRHSKKYSEPNGKDIYHERERIIKNLDDDYGKDYRSHKSSRYH
ncbi:hypothetical protein RND81_03G115200 [Saponaria officinalis]|uniref:Uncharacterized protein n=1 Tax=Saponaria officinalis TaxID=3572 RepID=A0AAW1M819_SAPOF